MNKFLSLLLISINLISVNNTVDEKTYISNFQGSLISNGYLITFDFYKNDLKEGQLEFKHNNLIINFESIKYDKTEISFLINFYDYKISNKELESIKIQYNDFTSIKQIDKFYIRNIDSSEFNIQNSLEFECPLLIYDKKTIIKKEYELLSNALYIPKDVKLSSTNYFTLNKFIEKDLVYTSFYLYINQAKYLLDKSINQDYLYLYSTKETFDINDEEIDCKLSIIYEHNYYYKVDFNVNLKTDLLVDNSSGSYEYKCEVYDV